MLWAHGIIVLSVTCGTLLALLPRKKDAWIGPARTFALMAALSVVIVHLIPEAMEGLGAMSIALFLLGFFAPGLLGRFGSYLYQRRRGGKTGKEIALETSYAGLLLHRVGDGLGLGAFTGEVHFAENGGVITALAAHSVPYVAIVVLTFDSVRGRGSAIGRAIGLALASMLGVVLARLLPLETFAEANSWVAALVGGMLLHVVSHDLESQSPVTRTERAVDLGAALVGVVVSVLGSHAHGAEGGELGSSVLMTLVRCASAVGPLFLLGLAVFAALASARRAPSAQGAGWVRRSVRAFDEASFRVGAWVLAGIVLVSLLEASLVPWVSAVVGGGPLDFVRATMERTLWRMLAGLSLLSLLRLLFLRGTRAFMAELGLGHHHEHGEEDGPDGHAHGHAHGSSPGHAHVGESAHEHGGHRH